MSAPFSWWKYASTKNSRTRLNKLPMECERRGTLPEGAYTKRRDFLVLNRAITCVCNYSMCTQSIASIEEALVREYLRKAIRTVVIKGPLHYHGYDGRMSQFYNFTCNCIVIQLHRIYTRLSKRFTHFIQFVCYPVQEHTTFWPRNSFLSGKPLISL